MLVLKNYLVDGIKSIHFSLPENGYPKVAFNYEWMCNEKKIRLKPAL